MADTPQYKATHRYAPMAARKARPVASLVRGLPVSEALAELEFIPRRAAHFLRKVIKSAAANAGQEGGVEIGDLIISSARVNDGPLKQNRLRFRPGPMGRAHPIHKRTCHIEVMVQARPSVGGRRPSRAAEATEEEN